MCNAERYRRGFTTDDSCTICREGVENIEHLFRGCSEVVSQWKAFIADTEFQHQQALSFEDWFAYNLSSPIKSIMNHAWNVVFSTTL
ncbi:hypothetical protein PTKIN_Ptkin17bG0131100 [Pterospermum kingtungense]